ncbi:hypothetical protein ACFU5O_07430 [Streptomyces sp. NPDC057445]|uniref:hypothetical protein n=1 Tax=Streptomyces sp. NPDC057445 TaxID=3346136 RepID=UPI0036A52761
MQIADTPARGPVFLSLPMDDMDAELTDAEDRAARAAASRRISRAAPPAAEVLENRRTRRGPERTGADR